MHRNILLLARGLAIAALAMCLGGCGKHQFEVTGKVTYNGAPLTKPNGQIVFVGPDGSQVAVPIGQDGAYKATKVTAGLNRVAIYYPNPDYKKSARSKGKPDPKSRPADSPMYLTPESYATPDTSQLQVEVAKATVSDFDMKGPPIP
jgi:hypothetical protein